MTCKDCGKNISSVSTRCQPCNGKSHTNPSNTCVDCGKEINRRSTRCQSCANSKNKIGRKHTEEHKQKILEANFKRWDSVGRVTNPGRRYYDYTIWRKDVLEHDDYTCQHCESKENLEVHHMEDYNSNPGLRTELSNGITFCKSCHDNFHHLFGNQSTRAQVFWFLKNVKLGKV